MVTPSQLLTFTSGRFLEVNIEVPTSASCQKRYFDLIFNLIHDKMYW
jgi:hypothetical protein